LLNDIQTSARFAIAHSYGSYSTNVPLADLRGGKAWIAFRFDGKELEREHGGPARLLVPHLYFWKSAKWVRGLTSC
jgi:DMSO/TMAO reductase YedYZ molybdopterin-dependent catalytic subunit